MFNRICRIDLENTYLYSSSSLVNLNLKLMSLIPNKLWSFIVTSDNSSVYNVTA